MPRVLHVLSQRPSLTGSGVTLDALVRHAAAASWSQRVVCGLPAGEPVPAVGGIDPAHVLPLYFGAGRLGFPVPGMSDVMPYPSTRFSAMTAEQRAAYREAWSEHLARAIDGFAPDVVHAHHVWLVASMLKDVAPGLPVVTHCHATGLRQMRLCPDLAAEVRRGVARNERFLALHAGDAAEIARRLEIERERVEVVGAGYREEVFHARGREEVRASRLVYVGKYSAAKGLPWLLDAVERLAASRPGLELHVVGSGAGPEAERLRDRMQSLGRRVRLHGTMAQEQLASLLRTCRVLVLPSLYEGVPLVLVEALACGCRPVATDLTGVRDELAPHLGSALIRVPPPRRLDVDVPDPCDLPAFVDDLERAIGVALDEPPSTLPSLERFSWSAVFRRVERVWLRLCA